MVVKRLWHYNLLFSLCVFSHSFWLKMTVCVCSLSQNHCCCSWYSFVHADCFHPCLLSHNASLLVPYAFACPCGSPFCQTLCSGKFTNILHDACVQILLYLQQSVSAAPCVLLTRNQVVSLQSHLFCVTVWFPWMHACMLCLVFGQDAVEL